MAASASSAAEKFRNKAASSTEKADAATQILNDAKAKATRAAEIAAAVATDLKTTSNQVVQYKEKIQNQVETEKKIATEIKQTEVEIQQAIKSYEQIRVDISSYVATYNDAKRAADEAAKIANEKEAAAARSKVVADNALEAYRMAAGGKNVISTEKPFTSATADVGENLQTSISASDLAKLKKIADEALARYNADKKAAESAKRNAEKFIAAFEKVKANLEAKVAAGKSIQIKIRDLQDSLNANRNKLAQVRTDKNDLFEKLRTTQAKVTETQNKLTLAQVEAQKAKVAAEKAALTVKKHQNDADNANTVADANDVAVQAAKDAAIDIEASSNSIDKIVSSQVADSAVKSLPMILGAVGLVVAVALVSMYAIRRARRRGLQSSNTVIENPVELEFDFDRILAEIRASEKVSKPKVSAAPRAQAKKATVRKATKKPRAR